MACGDLLPLLLGQLLKQKKDMRRLRRKRLLQPGHVRNFLILLWGITKHILLEADHKPFVPLLGVKDLHCLPPRILRFCLRLDRFSFDITHVPGKELYTADTLSRAPLHSKISDDSAELSELAELCSTCYCKSPCR